MPVDASSSFGDFQVSGRIFALVLLVPGQTSERDRSSRQEKRSHQHDAVGRVLAAGQLHCADLLHDEGGILVLPGRQVEENKGYLEQGLRQYLPSLFEKREYSMVNCQFSAEDIWSGDNHRVSKGRSSD